MKPRPKRNAVHDDSAIQPGPGCTSPIGGEFYISTAQHSISEDVSRVHTKLHEPLLGGASHLRRRRTVFRDGVQERGEQRGHAGSDLDLPLKRHAQPFTLELAGSSAGQ